MHTARSVYTRKTQGDRLKQLYNRDAIVSNAIVYREGDARRRHVMLHSWKTAWHVCIALMSMQQRAWDVWVKSID